MQAANQIANAPSVLETLFAPADYLYYDLLKLGQPWQRAAFTFAAATAIEMYVQPSIMFNGKNPRPWSFTDGKSKHATSVPWWLVPTSLGVLAGLIV